MERYGLTNQIFGFVRAKDLKEGEKILVFAPDIDKLKYIKRTLNCGLYTARHKDKEQDFEAWRQGTYSTMCATSALGAGIDIPGIVLVVHVGFMFDVFTFQQGAGRGGRGGKLAWSLTLIQNSWFERTGRTDPRRKSMPVRALESYLQTEICRQQPLSAYFNGNDAVTCSTLDANPCDLCQRQMQGSKPIQRVISKRPLTIDGPEQSKRQKIVQREEAIQERLRVEAVLEAKVRERVEILQSRCYVCWFRQGDYQDHSVKECPLDMLFNGAEEVSIQRKDFPENHACFACGLPCDWCKDYITGGAQGCTRLNVIYAVAELTLHCNEWLNKHLEWTQGQELV